MRMIAFPNVILVRKNFPANTLPEFLEYAKKQQTQVPVSYGSVGMGSQIHLFFAQIEAATGAKMNHIPFKGAADQIPAIIGGHLDAAALSVPVAQNYVNSGQMKRSQ